MLRIWVPFAGAPVPVTSTLGKYVSAKLSPKDQALYSAADEVLHYIWDPIGVSGVPQARDEYHGYVPQVVNLLRSGAREEDIVSYLCSVATEQMGLSENSKRDQETASVLIDWKETLDEKFA